MASFFNTLLIVFLVMVLVGYLLRILLPWILPWMAKRMLKRMAMENFIQPPSKANERNRSTSPSGQDRNSRLDNVGDYTDYEEVK